jgi:hypothetical protein
MVAGEQAVLEAQHVVALAELHGADEQICRAQSAAMRPQLADHHHTRALTCRFDQQKCNLPRQGDGRIGRGTVVAETHEGYREPRHHLHQVQHKVHG